MAKAWTDIPATDLDAESPVTEGLVGDFFDNQESLISQPADTRFAEAVGPSVVEVEIYVPPSAATAAGDVDLVLRLEAKAAAATTGQLRAKLGAGSFVSTATFTNTAYAFFQITIPATDVQPLADTVAILTIETLRTAGAGAVTARCITASSRFERAA